MSSNPYENEPGFEDQKEAHDKKNMKDYIDKVRNSLWMYRNRSDIAAIRYDTSHSEFQ